MDSVVLQRTPASGHTTYETDTAFKIYKMADGILSWVIFPVFQLRSNIVSSGYGRDSTGPISHDSSHDRGSEKKAGLFAE